jgi:hypothetical protein
MLTLFPRLDSGKHSYCNTLDKYLPGQRVRVSELVPDAPNDFDKSHPVVYMTIKGISSVVHKKVVTISNYLYCTKAQHVSAQGPSSGAI